MIFDERKVLNFITWWLLFNSVLIRRDRAKEKNESISSGTINIHRMKTIDSTSHYHYDYIKKPQFSTCRVVGEFNYVNGKRERFKGINRFIWKLMEEKEKSVSSRLYSYIDKNSCTYSSLRTARRIFVDEEKTYCEDQHQLLQLHDDDSRAFSVVVVVDLDVHDRINCWIDWNLSYSMIILHCYWD